LLPEQTIIKKKADMISTFVSYREANTITPKQLCAEELDTIQLEKAINYFY